MNKTIKVTFIYHHGRESFRPACEVSRLFAELLGQKLLTRDNVTVIQRLGYEIEFIAPNLETVEG